MDTPSETVTDIIDSIKKSAKGVVDILEGKKEADPRFVPPKGLAKPGPILEEARGSIDKALGEERMDIDSRVDSIRNASSLLASRRDIAHLTRIERIGVWMSSTDRAVSLKREASGIPGGAS